jgi:hypothetical protein
MKTFAKFTFAGIAATLLTTGSVFASDAEWRSSDYGNAHVAYRARPVKDGWFFSSWFHGKGGARGEANQHTRVRFERVSTPSGSISYYRPAP